MAKVMKIFGILVVVAVVIMTAWYVTPHSYANEYIARLNNSVVLHVGYPQAFVKGNKINIDAEDKNICPVIVNDRIMVPIKFISKCFNVEVKWNEEEKSILLKKGSNTIYIKIGEQCYYKNSQEANLDVAPQIIREKAFVPLKIVADDLMNKKVFYENKIVIISDSEVREEEKEKGIVEALRRLFFNSDAKSRIAAGRVNSAFVSEDGNVYVWGKTSPYLDTLFNRPVKIDSSEDVVEVACSSQRTYALKKDGSVYYCVYAKENENNENRMIKIEDIDNIVSISSGHGGKVFAIKEDGTLWTWNDVNYTGEEKLVDIRPIRVYGINEIKKVCSGKGFSMALSYDGKVYIWGENSRGQTGKGKISVLESPQEVPNLGYVVDIAAGENTAYALKLDGTVWGWGSNENKELGFDYVSENRGKIEVYPVRVPNIDNVFAISATNMGCAAINKEGNIYFWGCYDFIEAQYTTEPKLIYDKNNVCEIKAGLRHVLALTRDGKVLSWGYNGYGQLGDKSNFHTRLPKIIFDKNVPINQVILDNSNLYNLNTNFYDNTNIEQKAESLTSELLNLNIHENNFVTVSTAKELIESIKSDCTIVLKEGIYDISEGFRKGANNSKLFKVDKSNDYELYFKDIHNLKIRAEKSGTVTIMQKNRTNSVMGFIESNGIEIQGIKFLATYDFDYSDLSILSFKNCKNILLKDLFITGAAFDGLDIKNVEGFVMNGCSIEYAGGINFSDSNKILVSKTTMTENKYAEIFTIRNSENIVFSECNIRKNNGVYLFIVDINNSVPVIKNTNISDNTISYFQYLKDSVYVKDVNFSNNSFLRQYVCD